MCSFLIPFLSLLSLCYTHFSARSGIHGAQFIAVLRTLLWQLGYPAILGFLSADCSLLILLWHGLWAIFFFTCSVIVFFIKTWPPQRCPFKNIVSFGLYSLGHVHPKCQRVKGLVLSFKLSEVVEILEVGPATSLVHWEEIVKLQILSIFCFLTMKCVILFCHLLLPRYATSKKGWMKEHGLKPPTWLLVSWPPPILIFFFSLQYIMTIWGYFWGLAHSSENQFWAGSYWLLCGSGHIFCLLEIRFILLLTHAWNQP